MQYILTKEAPAPGGHYSQAVIANGFVFVAGQLPLGPAGLTSIPEGITAQAELVLANLQAILRASNSDLDKVVSLNVFITDISLWPAVNEVCARAFGSHKPARAIAVSPQLHFGCLVEMQATALA
jgi:2-iminobutanoate/2-iminopropanoate deaminase